MQQELQKYRDKVEVISSILQECKSRQREYDIIQNSRITWRQAEKYLPFLVQRGLLEIKEEVSSRNDLQCKYYYLTKEGVEFLKLLEKIIEVLN